MYWWMMMLYVFYLIVRDGGIVTAVSLPYEVDSEMLVRELYIFDDCNFGRDLCCFHYHYHVVDKNDMVFGEAQYRVFRIATSERFDERRRWSMDDLRRFNCVEMEYRFHKIALRDDARDTAVDAGGRDKKVGDGG